MKRVVIVVEGQTEQEFVRQCIAPYLLNKYGLLSISARLIGKPGHKGGDVRYKRLKVDLDILLREQHVVISTLIDFFKLASDFPNNDNCLQYSRAEDKIICLEQGLMNAVGAPLFIPYIQRHEFEALLFASVEGFEKYFSPETCEKLAEVKTIYPNPEDINSSQPPSYRLINIIKQYEGFKYDKVTFGNIIALEVGMEEMLANCPCFAIWINKLSQAAST